MRNRGSLALLLVILMVTMCACSSNRSETPLEPDGIESAVSESSKPKMPEPTAIETQFDEHLLYDAVLSSLKDVLQSISENQENDDLNGELEEAGFSYVYRFNPTECGYTYIDVDGDGTDELLVGCNADSYNEGKTFGLIYDLYSIKDNELVHVFSSGERYMLSYCSDGLLRVIGSSSAFNTRFSYYALVEGELRLL